eukprot:TRINITY_DN31136_c0_g1_i1.p1 TRINITY_DN31136_c0_g1~~TRINITY_DN31136_c0_g1_i1.p1  ORF type:complete len:782 (+),score=140.44 TRINITY_DN31136_c0_g1_i1:80-2347(+)
MVAALASHYGSGRNDDAAGRDARALGSPKTVAADSAGANRIPYRSASHSVPQKQKRSQLEEYTHALEVRLTVKTALLDEALSVHQSLNARLAVLEQGLSCKDAALDAVSRKCEEASRASNVWRENAERLEEENVWLRDLLMERHADQSNLVKLLEVQAQQHTSPRLSPLTEDDDAQRSPKVECLFQELKESNQRNVLLEEQLRVRSGSGDPGFRSTEKEDELPEFDALRPDDAWAFVGRRAADRLCTSRRRHGLKASASSSSRSMACQENGALINIATGGTLLEESEQSEEDEDMPVPPTGVGGGTADDAVVARSRAASPAPRCAVGATSGSGGAAAQGGGGSGSLEAAVAQGPPSTAGSAAASALGYVAFQGRQRASSHGVLHIGARERISSDILPSESVSENGMMLKPSPASLAHTADSPAAPPPRGQWAPSLATPAKGPVVLSQATDLGRHSSLAAPPPQVVAATLASQKLRMPSRSVTPPVTMGRGSVEASPSSAPSSACWPKSSGGPLGVGCGGCSSGGGQSGTPVVPSPGRDAYHFESSPSGQRAAEAAVRTPSKTQVLPTPARTPSNGGSVSTRTPSSGPKGTGAGDSSELSCGPKSVDSCRAEPPPSLQESAQAHARRLSSKILATHGANNWLQPSQVKAVGAPPPKVRVGAEVPSPASPLLTGKKTRISSSPPVAKKTREWTVSPFVSTPSPARSSASHSAGTTNTGCGGALSARATPTTVTTTSVATAVPSAATRAIRGGGGGRP